MAALDGDRLAKAVALAVRWHGEQTRKGSDTPYVAHLFQVCGFVLEHGGDCDQAVAALLHDAIEDTEEATRESIAADFGERVAKIVGDCTDTLPGDTPETKAPWKVRKERYLEHLKEVDDESLLVAACDKRHNIGSLVVDLQTKGLGYLRNFNSTPRQQIWYFEEFLSRITGRIPMGLQLELKDLVFSLKTLIQGGETQLYKKTDMPKKG